MAKPKNTIMKKIILLFYLAFSTSLLFAQNTQGVGFFAPQPEEKFIAGSDDITKLWADYIEAHNKQDMEKIMSMNSDSIYIQAPNGSTIVGKEQHKNFLTTWFKAENPKWEIYWAMPYRSVPSGADWIIAGHRESTTVNGKKVLKNAMIDVEVTDGLIRRFFVYTMDLPDEVSN